MFNAQTGIFSGPDHQSELRLKGTLGQMIYKSLKKLPGEFKTHINGVTDEYITANESLEGAAGVVYGFRALSLPENSIVALVGSYGKNQFMVHLGTLFEGFTFFGIPPSFKPLEYQHVLSIRTPNIIFVEKNSLDSIMQTMLNLKIHCPIFVVDSDEPVNGVKSYKDFIKSTSVSDFIPKHISNPENNVAFLMASSGTTGLPKGIAWTNRHCLAIVQNAQALSMETPLIIFQLYWATGCLPLFIQLALGVTFLYVRTLKAVDMLRAIENYKATSIQFVIPLITAVLEDPDFFKYDRSSIKNLVTVGTPLPKKTAQLMKSKWGNLHNVHMYQSYGCTEIGNCTQPLSYNGDKCPLESVGYLANDLQAKVIDDEGKSLGPNEVGEILLNSINRRSYYIDNPNVTQSNEFHRTGDIGSITETGLIHIVGRTKELILCSYDKVPPEVIEDVILGIEGVKDVAVLGVVDQIGSHVPIAVVSKKENTNITEQDIFNKVSDKLSDSRKLRGGVIFIQEIPYNINGKKLRSQLRKDLNLQ